MDIQRSILIVALAIVSYIMVLKWNEDYGQPQLPPPAVAANAAQALPTEPAQAAADVPTASTSPSVTATAAAVPSKQLIQVQTDVLKLAIDPQGGDVVQLALPQYPRSLQNRDVPFALFELVIPLAVPRQVTVRVEDACLVARNGIPTGRCESFAHQAAFLARQLAESGELVSGVVFAFAPEARRWLLDCRPSQLAELARHPAAIRPRWRTHAQFWQLLVGAACRSSVAALEWAHCIGLCLIGAEVATPAADGRRRQRP